MCPASPSWEPMRVLREWAIRGGRTLCRLLGWSSPSFPLKEEQEAHSINYLIHVLLSGGKIQEFQV